MNIRYLFRDWLTLSPAGRILILNGFTFNFGFYMLLPYLADHLQNNIGLSGWLIGLVLGLRVFSQQGLFLIGGTLSDHWGYRTTILSGCLVRTLGFILLGISDSIYGLLIGAFLTGFAGALFSPSSQAYLASEYPEQSDRDQVFALQNLTSEAGMLVGPLVGLALFKVSFVWIGWVSGGAFFLLFLIQWYFLPNDNTQSQQTNQRAPFLSQWVTMFRYREFMWFALWASIYQILFHQLYLAIPSAIKAITGDTYLITWVFMISSFLGIVLQMPIARLANRKLGTAKSMGLGMAIMGVAYLPLVVADFLWAHFIILLTASLFSIGSMLVFPLLGAWVPRYSKPTELASYYGLYACIGGIAAFLSNIVIGWALPVAAAPSDWLWIILCLLGVASGFMLYLLVK